MFEGNKGIILKVLGLLDDLFHAHRLNAAMSIHSCRWLKLRRISQKNVEACRMESVGDGRRRLSQKMSNAA